MTWQPVNLTEVCPAYSNLTACSPFGYVYLNLLVQLFGGSEDSREQGSNCNRDKERSGEEYDFIVVGAGSAGCIVANRLTEVKQWKVLLLEAGPEQPDVSRVPALSTSLLGSSIDWKFTTEPNGKSCLARKDQRCSWPRGKVMGGSSTVNSMAYVRGNRHDFDTWEKMGNPGWRYKDVLPYFKKSERNLNINRLDQKYHGTCGEQPIGNYPYTDKPTVMWTKAFQEKGIPFGDVNGAEQLTTFQAQAFQGQGKRFSTNNAFIQKIRNVRNNLTVRVLAEVLKILINKEGVAYGVQYKRNGKLYTAIANKEVILSAGTDNSPKILLLSGVGPRKHLEELNITVIKDLSVGENLHDHVTFNGILIELPDRSATVVSQERILQELQDYHDSVVKRGPLSGNGPKSAVAFMKTDPTLPVPDIQFQTGHCNLPDYVNDPLTYEKAFIYPTSFFNCMTIRIMNLLPKSRGRLLLNAENPHGPPLISPNFLDNPDDLKPFHTGFQFLLSLENTTAFKEIGATFSRTPFEACRGYKLGTEEYTHCLARNYTASCYHNVGTCKMGPRCDKTAVVDATLKVYGIKGLRVVDASIMPIVVGGNTNAAVMMIGEKGADLIKEDWFPKVPKNNCKRIGF